MGITFYVFSVLLEIQIKENGLCQWELLFGQTFLNLTSPLNNITEE